MTRRTYQPVAPPIPPWADRCRTLSDLLKHLDPSVAWKLRKAIVSYGGALGGASGLNWEAARRVGGSPETHPSGYASALMYERPC